MTSKSNQTKILIVGAGAMGLTLGCHLQLAGVAITFLVRPSRTADLARPQILYNYDDASLKDFDGFGVITSPEAVAALAPDYVIVTLDGAATVATEGTALLAALGVAIVDRATVMIGGGVGIGLHEHYLDATGLPENRLLMGSLGCLAYQVERVVLPLHSPTDPTILARADIAYRHSNKNGFMLENRSPATAKRFAALYNASDVSRCTVMEPHLFDIATNAVFPIFAGSELCGWCPVSDLAKHREVWRLTATAVREIAGLDRYGWRGKLAGLVLTDGMIARLWNIIDKGSRPLDFQAFNAFHHGGKVAAQDLAIMQGCLAAGEREGKRMTALTELLQRLDYARTAADSFDNRQPTSGGALRRPG